MMQTYRTARTTAAAGLIAKGAKLIETYQQPGPKPLVGFELEIPDALEEDFEELKDLLLKGGHGVSVDLGRYSLARAELTIKIRETERSTGHGRRE